MTADSPAEAAVRPVREVISINRAAALGIDKVRKPNWADPEDHIKIDIIEGKAGPWLHLYSPSNEEINGRNPVAFLEFQGRDDECFEPWTAPSREPGGGDA